MTKDDAQKSEVDLGTLLKHTDGQVPYYLITDVVHTMKACEVIEKESVVACDCEGVRLGRDGILTLVQIGTPTHVFLFDIVLGGKAMFAAGLGQLLTSKTLLKVMHDCRCDADALYHIYGVKLRNVFDTQLAFAIHHKASRGNYPYPVGLNTLLKKFIGINEADNPYREAIKDQLALGSEIFAQRPMSDDVIGYSVHDAKFILPVYEEIRKLLDDDKVRKVLEKSKSYSAQLRKASTVPSRGPDSKPSYGFEKWDDEIQRRHTTGQNYENQEFKVDEKELIRNAAPFKALDTVQKSLPSVKSVRYIQTLAEAEEARKKLSDESIISVDFQGTHHGRKAKIHLAQLCSRDSEVFLVDCTVGGGVLMKPLKSVLEDDTVLKVMHDCRADADALEHCYGIHLQNVFDTQVAYAVYKDGVQRPCGWDTVLQRVNDGAGNPFKSKVRGKDSNINFDTRPIDVNVIGYCVYDAFFIRQLYFKFKGYLSKAKMEEAEQRSKIYVDVFRALPVAYDRNTLDNGPPLWGIFDWDMMIRQKYESGGSNNAQPNRNGHQNKKRKME
eukprot:Clim_evm50s25 gene=Clim_evmTU50s25